MPVELVGYWMIANDKTNNHDDDGDDDDDDDDARGVGGQRPKLECPVRRGETKGWSDTGWGDIFKMGKSLALWLTTL